MKRKGFTLVELMGVIILLGVIAVITIPSVKELIKDSKQKSYDRQIDFIINGAKNWGITNSDLLPENGSTLVNVASLKKEGFLENERINNPLTNDEMLGCVLITYDSDYNQYTYEYNDACELSEANLGTAIYFNPVENAMCTDYVESNSVMGFKDGCLKWYVYKISEDNLGLILDHNTTDVVAWYSDGDDTTYNETNEHGPLTLMSQLETDTANWTVEADIIDVKDILVQLSWYNNLENKTAWESQYETDFLTAQNDALRKVEAKADSYSNELEILKAMIDILTIEHSDITLPSYLHQDLIDNCPIETMSCTTSGYWTKSASSLRTDNALSVIISPQIFSNYVGGVNLNTRNAVRVAPVGIRPVITLSKSAIQ